MKMVNGALVFSREPSIDRRVDMGGVFITPLEKDFRKIDAEHLEKILSEVCLDREKMYEIIEKLK